LMRAVAAALLAVAALAAVALPLVAHTSWLEPSEPDGYELRCIIVPSEADEGVYRVRITSVTGAPLRLDPGGYGEVAVVARVSYEGVGLGRLTLGPGSFRCEAGSSEPLVVEVVRGWEGRVQPQAVGVAPLGVGFWSRGGGPVTIEYLGVDGWATVREGGATIISEVAVFLVKAGGTG